MWRPIVATATGARHLRLGQASQDAVEVTGSGDEVVAMAVADGHGSPTSVRSDVGARLAAQVGSALLRIELSEDRFEPQRYVTSTVARWTDAVLADAAARPPLPPIETDTDPVLVAYGSTLIAAGIARDRLVLVQVGDGDAFVVGTDGNVTSALAVDDLVGGATRSLCLPDADRFARWAELDVSDTALVVLASDGYGNAFAESGWRERFGPDVLERVRRGGIANVQTGLREWVGAAAQVAGDDATVAILARTTDALA